MNSTEILREVGRYHNDMVAIRRQVHGFAELGFNEWNTANLVSKSLEKCGVSVKTGIAKTGVVGTLNGFRAGKKCIALRADMDALAINEETGLEYASSRSGSMHACGHDGHTTMLLGAAWYLASNRAAFAGKVHFIFQPAEEGQAGGRAMIEDGLFDVADCDEVFGMHNWPGLEEGRFGIRDGEFLAASDTWMVKFEGSGGHGAINVHKAKDPCIPTAQFILATQSIIGRDVEAGNGAVISIGHLSGGAFNAPNALPDTVVVRGTARCFEARIRDTLERRLRELASALADANGCNAIVEYKRRYPPLINKTKQVEAAIGAARSLVGYHSVETNMPRAFGAEDFAFMLERKPGAYILIGAGESTSALHSSHYDFNDRILTLGASYWVSLVVRELGVSA